MTTIERDRARPKGSTLKEDKPKPGERPDTDVRDEATSYDAWARSAALALTLRPLPAETPLGHVEDVLLEQLAPIAGGELRGAPAYLEASLPSHFWRAISSLGYALLLPAWPETANEDRPLVGGEERAGGLVLHVYYGPPAYDRSFVLCDSLEELTCTDRESLRRLWRRLASAVPRTPQDEP
jgi:hypothetical protein